MRLNYKQTSLFKEFPNIFESRCKKSLNVLFSEHAVQGNVCSAMGILIKIAYSKAREMCNDWRLCKEEELFSQRYSHTPLGRLSQERDHLLLIERQLQ